MPSFIVNLWLFAILALPVVAWVINIKARNWQHSSVVIAFWSALCIYLLLLLTVFFQNWYLDAELKKLDLNQDGFYSGAELTDEQAKAMENWASDTGRNFAPFTGAIFSVFYFLLVWGCGAFISRLFKPSETAT